MKIYVNVQEKLDHLCCSTYRLNIEGQDNDLNHVVCKEKASGLQITCEVILARHTDPERSTKRHEGGGTREMPLRQKLRAQLKQHYELMHVTILDCKASGLPVLPRSCLRFHPKPQWTRGSLHIYVIETQLIPRICSILHVFSSVTQFYSADYPKNRPIPVVATQTLVLFPDSH